MRQQPYAPSNRCAARLHKVVGKYINKTNEPRVLKSLKKAKAKLRELTSRSQGGNVRTVMQNVKIYIRGWLGYFGIARMKSTMNDWDGWLRRRFRKYIWKQWKKPKTRVKNLRKLGMPDWQAYRNGNTRKGYRTVAGSGILTHNAVLKENRPFEVRNLSTP